MPDKGLLRNWKLNKWTIGVITLGMFLNIGLTAAGRKKALTWQDVNQIRQWKEIVFAIVVGQSGKAVRRYSTRK